MYTPSCFKIDDPALIRLFIAENSFGILVSSSDGSEFYDTHLPLVLSKDGEYLLGHIAKANGHWRDWEGNSHVKAIFHGPHSYVSPTFYVTDFNVPTWNYTAVSISGDIQIVDDLEEQKEMMRALVDHHEGGATDSWTLDESNEKLMQLFAAILFFKIRIRKTEAKFKLNQNKSREDQESVIRILSESRSTFDRSVAQMMTENLENED